MMYCVVSNFFFFFFFSTFFLVMVGGTLTGHNLQRVLAFVWPLMDTIWSFQSLTRWENVTRSFW